jgi:hypothetical protein
VTIRPGTAVTGLVTGPEALGGVPHVTGVLLDRGGASRPPRRGTGRCARCATSTRGSGPGRGTRRWRTRAAGESLTDVQVLAGIEDRYRRFVVVP